MTRRYFAPQLEPEGCLVELSRQESVHAAKVMRLQPGDRVELFDGRGNEAEGQIIALDPGRVQIRAEASRHVSREPPIQLTLALSLPRPERGKEMVERLTELGVHQLIPLICQRTQRPPSENQLQKLRRVVVEASKQCGRNELLRIGEPVTLETAIKSLAADQRWVLDPTVHRSLQPLKPDTTVAAFVGPEGGWTDDELTLLGENHIERISLGPRIYRIETAATVVAARLLD